MTADYTRYAQAAQAVAGGQLYPAPALYMTAVPIGNLADISLRALHVLNLADVVFCEDTRNSGILLRQYGLHKELTALHQHNEQRASEQVLQHLERGHRVVYISDAGTPGISDPGSVLCRKVRAAGYRVLPVPGVSSVSALLSVAGCDTAQGYLFRGFLPGRSKAREDALRGFLAQPLPVVFFEAPHRLMQLAQSLQLLCEERAEYTTWQLLAGRELTKRFEQVVCMPAQELQQWLEQGSIHLRGEFVLLLYRDSGTSSACGGQHSDAGISEAADALLRDLLEHVPTKAAAAIVSRHTGDNKKALYRRAVEVREAQ